MVEITATEKNKEKRMKKTEVSLRDIWDNIKCTNICITGVPEGEVKEKGSEKISEEITTEFPKNGKGNTLSGRTTEESLQNKPQRNTA